MVDKKSLNLKKSREESQARIMEIVDVMGEIFTEILKTKPSKSFIEYLFNMIRIQQFYVTVYAFRLSAHSEVKMIKKLHSKKPKSVEKKIDVTDLLNKYRESPYTKDLTFKDLLDAAEKLCDLSKIEYVLFESLMIYSLAQFEWYIRSILTEAFLVCPKALKSKKQTLSDEEVAMGGRKLLATRRAEEIVHNYQKTNAYLTKIKVKSFNAKFKELSRIYEARHCLVHTGRTIDSKYLKNTGDKRYKEGDKLSITEDEFKTSLKLLLEVALKLDKEMIKKFKLSPSKMKL